MNLPSDQTFYYTTGTVGAAIGVLTFLWAKAGKWRWVQVLRDKSTLVEERNRAIRAAEASRDYAELTSLATAELRGVINGLSAQVQANSDHIEELRRQIDDVSQRFRLAMRFIERQIGYIVALRELLADHAPTISIPEEPRIPSELRDELSER